MSNEAIYKLHVDCGRMGTIYGLFIAEKGTVEQLVRDEVQVCFGEVLGKHSDISGSMDDTDYTLVTDDQLAVEMFKKYDLSVGYNPFHYIEDVDDNE